jgi:hypothetical protein
MYEMLSPHPFLSLKVAAIKSSGPLYNELKDKHRITYYDVCEWFLVNIYQVISIGPSDMPWLARM